MREVYWDVPRRLIFLCAFVLLAAVLLFLPIPMPMNYMGRTIENAGHTPLFMLATVFVLLYLRDDFKKSGPALYAFAGLIGIGAGFMSEVIQKPLRRDASWEDVLADAVGVVSALAVFALFDRRSAIGKPTRVAALAVVLVCFVSYFEPIVRMTRAYLHRDGQFPVLADFHSATELYWLVGYGVNRDIVGGALEVEFDAEQFPGFSFHEPVPDWRAFKTLLIDVENAEPLPLKLGLRVHDVGHGRIFHDRFNRLFDLAPRERRTLKVALEDVRHGPRNRLMNMERISDITLFRGGQTGSRHLRLYSMRLE